MEEYISSRQNRTVVMICKLADKKNRESERLFRFDGVKLYCEATLSGAELRYVLLRESDEEAVKQRIQCLGGVSASECGAKVLVLSDGVFDAVSEEKSPEGIISVAKYIDKFHKIVTIDNNFASAGEDFCGAEERILLLEDIRDPGNLGTIMRTASALGVDRLLLCGDCADVYNPKTLRGSMGAVFRLRTDVCRDGAAAVSALRRAGRRVYAAAVSEDALPLGKAGLTPLDCVVIGNEGHGLSRDITEACCGCVSIPMRTGSESLNAAAAATIFMWETARTV